MAEHLNPFFTEQGLAQQLLASRGIPPTPENINRAIAALQENPDLAARFSQQAAIRTPFSEGREEISSTNPIAAAFAEPFDRAFTEAVNGSTPDGTGPSQVAPAVAQPAPETIPVEVAALSALAAQTGAPQGQPPAPIRKPDQLEQLLPGEFDEVAQQAAEREFTGGLFPEDLPFIPVVPVPLSRRRGAAGNAVSGDGAGTGIARNPRGAGAGIIDAEFDDIIPGRAPAQVEHDIMTRLEAGDKTLAVSEQRALPPPERVVSEPGRLEAGPRSGASALPSPDAPAPEGLVAQRAARTERQLSVKDLVELRNPTPDVQNVNVGFGAERKGASEARVFGGQAGGGRSGTFIVKEADGSTFKGTIQQLLNSQGDVRFVTSDGRVFDAAGRLIGKEGDLLSMLKQLKNIVRALP